MTEQPESRDDLTPDTLRARRRGRLHTVQIPALRLVGFSFVSLLVLVFGQYSSSAARGFDPAMVLMVNAAYVAFTWIVLWTCHGKTGRLDLTFLFSHLDIALWVFNVHHVGGSPLLLVLLLLARVGDSVGFSFARAFYFTHVVTAVFLAYTGWFATGLTPAERWMVGLALYAVGAHISMVALVVTRLRNRSERARRDAESLVQTLEARTVELERQAIALEQARSEAEVAARSKSAFLATMSHEIRTPLNGVIGMTELLRHTPLSQTQQDYLQTIRGCGQGLAVILNDILDYSKIESGKMELELRPTDVNELVQSCVMLLKPKADEKGIALHSDVAPDVPSRVLSDGTRLRQVLINLLSNAIKFTNAGHVRVRVRVLNHGEGDALTLRWTVTDTGVGMTDEQMGKLFQPFTLADASVSRRFGGTGLGLAISQRLVQAMGGLIEVSSVPNRGSTFNFSLPTEAVNHAEATDSVPSWAVSELSAELSTSPPAARALKILVAEDNPVNQMVAELTVQKLGHQPTVVANGRLAVEAVLNDHYDMVLMDMQMPEMDGLTATREIVRLMPPERRPFIVGLSANAMVSDVQAGRDAGMDHYLGKPFAMDDLQAVINACASRLPSAET